MPAEEKSQKVDRRRALQVIGGTVAGLVIGGAVGYLAKPAEIVEKTTVYTTTVAGPATTLTLTKTVTLTPTPTIIKAKKLNIAFWVGNLASPYWITCKDGAEKAAKDINDHFGEELCTITTFDARDDPALQTSQIESVIGAGIYGAAVLPAVVAEAMVPAFKKLYDAKIPTITYDREIAPEGMRYRLFSIITNNVEAGALETEALIRQLENTGKPKPWKIAINYGHPGASSAEDRRSGHRLVLDPLVAKGDVIIVNEQYHEGWKRELARATIEAVLARHPDLAAVVCSNDDMALGSIAAIEGAGKVPGVDVLVAGFDAISEAVEAVRKGKLNVTIAQAAKIMGYWGAYSAFLHINTGWTSPVETIPAPVVVVTKENVETFAPLMEPPRWDLWKKYGPTLTEAFPK
jgi:ribose transport system substrate-binding protein